MNKSSPNQKIWLLLILSFVIVKPGLCQFIPLDSAYVKGSPTFYLGMGDSWMTTWGSDDKIYATWGDGTGLGYCYPRIYPELDQCRKIDTTGIDKDIWYMDIFCGLNWTNCQDSIYCPCIMTDAGLSAWDGPIEVIQRQEIIAWDIPTGNRWFDRDGIDAVPLDRNDKPSSILWCNETLYLAAHEPPGDPEVGYLAFSTDGGNTWTDLHEGSPWRDSSRFRVLMFINMGQAYNSRVDDHVYALAMGVEAGWPDYDQKIFLTRVHMNHIAEYDQYQYLASIDEHNQPSWTHLESDAIPLENLQSYIKGSAIFHEQTQSFLFFTAEPPRLYQAETPWGPWQTVVHDMRVNLPEDWHSLGFILSLIPKDTDHETVYFTASGITDYNFEDYQLAIGKLKLVHQTTSMTNAVSPPSNFKIYPNPNAGVLELRITEDRHMNIEILDTFGQVVKKLNDINPHHGTIEINLSSIPAGIYWIREQNKNYTEKIIKL